MRLQSLRSKLLVAVSALVIGSGLLISLLVTHRYSTISWRGTLSQYAGRLHRIYDRKKEVVIYDYVDVDVPVLVRMYERRTKGYRSIGYEVEDKQS